MPDLFARRLARFLGRAPTCAACGTALQRREARFALADADALATALDLADPDRLARVPPAAADTEPLVVAILSCPRCQTGRLRMQTRLEGRSVQVGPVYELYAPFLGDVLAALPVSPPATGR